MKAIVFYHHQNGNVCEVEVQHRAEYPNYWKAQWREFCQYIGVYPDSYFHVEFEHGEPRYNWELEQALKSWH